LPGSDSLRVLTCLALATALLGLSACSSSGPQRPAAGAGQTVDAAASDAMDPDEVVPELALASYRRALDALRDGDLTEAELELEQLILAYPAYAGPHVNLGIVYMATGRDDDALAAFSTALSLNPQHAQAYNQLGILARRQGRFADAEQAYRDALAADSSYPLAHYNLGVLLDLYLQRPADALTHYEAYQALLPETDKTVAKWIVELRRRVGASEAAARVAAEDVS